jgi:hypothetical protein
MILPYQLQKAKPVSPDQQLTAGALGLHFELRKSESIFLFSNSKGTSGRKTHFWRVT